MTLDRSSAGFIVKLITPSSATGMAGRATNKGKKLDLDVSDRVLKFVFEDIEDKADILKLTVDNHDLFFFDSPGFAKGNLVEFSFGYPGQVFGPRIHVIDNMRGFEKLDIIAIEETALMNKERSDIYEDMTRADVVREVIKRGAFIDITQADIDEEGIKDEKARDWNQTGITDWQFLQTLAEDIDYQVYVEGNVLHFHPRRLAQTPRRKFEYWYGNGDLQKFVLEQFAATDLAAETEVASFDPVERETKTAKGSDEETTRDTLGKEAPITLVRGGTGGLQETFAGAKKIPSPETDGATLKAEADSHFKEHELGQVEASAEIRGDPWLGAKTVIEIQGISRLLSGLYYVKGHTHTISVGGGYTGKLALARNAVNKMPIDDAPTTSDKAQDNQKETQENQAYTRDEHTGGLEPVG